MIVKGVPCVCFFFFVMGALICHFVTDQSTPAIEGGLVEMGQGDVPKKLRE